MGRKPDFSGWATKFDIKCADGRTIRKGAFDGCDGKTVPLVWQHQHDSIENVLGHAVLEKRDEGIYAYGYLNDTELGNIARKDIANGDLKALSIYANKLQEKGGNVFHGIIREVSLVLSGANDGAVIDFPVIAHGDGYAVSTEEAIIAMSAKAAFGDPDSSCLKLVEDNDDDSLSHADDEESGDDGDESPEDILASMTDKQRNYYYASLSYAIENAEDLRKSLSDGDNEEGSNEENDGDEAVEHSSEGDDEDMKRNIFENTEDDKAMIHGLSYDEFNTLQHDVFAHQTDYKSLKAAFLAHAASTYGIEDVDWLFPDAKNYTNTPVFIKRPDNWVQYVMNNVHHTPYSAIKTMFADITPDEARAKGYTKGNLKMEEVFGLLKRETRPTTVYKKQKMDKDDINDITSFDVVAWLKAEMRLMLDEELARGFLFSDGRSTLSKDKIREDCIRPIVKDAELFTIQYPIIAGSTDDETTKNVIRGAIKSRKKYRGSGKPTAFMSEDMLSEMLLLEDTQGYSLYKTETELATKLRVKEIVTVPDDIFPEDIYVLIVNLYDYNVGADKGGSVNMFEDFDIDYNQEKYLIETRCSGALTLPYSAIVLTKPSNP